MTSACVRVKYDVAKKQPSPINIKSCFIVFDFSSRVSGDEVFKKACIASFSTKKIAVDTLSIGPLSFLSKNDVSERIRAKGPDFVFVVTPLSSTVISKKYRDELSSISYLIDVRAGGYEEPIIRKCIVSISHPDYFGNTNQKIADAINALLN